jgi:hypothetical protein
VKIKLAIITIIIIGVIADVVLLHNPTTQKATSSVTAANTLTASPTPTPLPTPVPKIEITAQTDLKDTMQKIIPQDFSSDYQSLKDEANSL